MPYLSPPSGVKGTSPTALGSASAFMVGQQFLDSVKTADYTNDFGVFLIFDGRKLQKEDYEELFNYFAGSQYQIDSNSFRLPDPRAKTLGIAGGSHALGTSTGSETRTLSTSHLPSHSHTINHDHPSSTTSSSGAHSHTVSVPYKNQNAPYGDLSNNRTVWEYVTTTNRTTSSSGSHTHNTSTPSHSGNSGNTGSNQAFSIMQPTAFLFNVFIYAGR